jgi:soluble lytic murein transglycosylase-like protein
MDTVGRVSRIQGRDWVIERHLLGLGLLFVTVSAGYFLSAFSGAREVRAEARAVVPEARVQAALMEIAPMVTEPEGGDPDDLDAYIKQVAARYAVPSDLVAAVIDAESSRNPRAVSRRGARGLMQLMPKTAKRLGVEDPFDPHANIEAGVKHLRAMIDIFGNDLPRVLAAYNAGEVAVIKHRGVPPYRETRAYVKRIVKKLDRSTVAVQL